MLDPHPSQAFKGIRVLDLTIIAAGAGATMLLADMGAEVIKVESQRYLDSFRNARIWPNNDPGERPYNRAAPFNTMNRNKLEIALDLTTARGQELFIELAKISDVVANNFRVGVMKKLGIDYEVLKKAKPELVVIDISSQGSYGPEAHYGSYGSTLDALSGLAYVTGYRDGPPVWSGQTINYPDQLSCTLAAGAIMAGLYHRMVSGKGCYIDFSQRESVTSLIGEMVLDTSLNSRQPERKGNSHDSMAPHGCYPSAGEDQWVTIAIRSDAEWQTLCRVMKRLDLASDARFVQLSGRLANQEEVDGLISEWTVLLEPYEAFRLLSESGLTAGPVFGGEDLLSDPHLKARAYFQDVPQPEAGTYPIKTRPMKLSKTDGTIHKPAPLFAEHNESVLSRLLHLSSEEIAQLEADGVIGSLPTTTNRRS